MAQTVLAISESYAIHCSIANDLRNGADYVSWVWIITATYFAINIHRAM